MIAGAAMFLQCRLWIFQMWQIEATQVTIINFDFFNVLIADINLCFRCIGIMFNVLIAVFVVRMNAVHITDRVNRQEFIQIDWKCTVVIIVGGRIIMFVACRVGACFALLNGKLQIKSS